MIENRRSRSKVVQMGPKAETAEELPYEVELCDGKGVERVLARAHNAQLARAIFKAAVTEHPERRIILRRGGRVIADSAG